MRTPTAAQKSSLIRRVPVFAHVSARQVAELSRALDVIVVGTGDVLLEQGTHGHAFYLVVEGSAKVLRGGLVVGSAGPGDVIGEQAMLGAGQRDATVVAETPMTLLTGTRPAFASLLSDFPALGAQVRATSSARLA